MTWLGTDLGMEFSSPLLSTPSIDSWLNLTCVGMPVGFLFPPSGRADGVRERPLLLESRLRERPRLLDLEFSLKEDCSKTLEGRAGLKIPFLILWSSRHQFSVHPLFG